MSDERDTASPEQLIAVIARERSREAFRLFFGLFAPRVHRFLLSRGVDTSSADELTQEVMLTVWHKAEGFDATRGAAAAWIFTLARNALIDRARRDRLAAAARDEQRAELATTVADETPADFHGHRRLAVALADLPPEQLSTLEAVYVRGLSMAEVAAQHCLPIGTVKTRVRLAMARLRERIPQGGDA